MFFLKRFTCKDAEQVHVIVGTTLIVCTNSYVYCSKESPGAIN